MFEKSTVELLGYSVFQCEEEVPFNAVKGVINTICPHSYVLARKDSLFSEALKASDILLPDGVGIVLATRVLSGKLIKKVSGSDIHKGLITALDDRKGSCFYLGASDDTLRRIKERLSREHPSLRVGSFSPPYKTIFNDDDNNVMINVINAFDPEVLFVGMTAPKQEKWVFQNRNLLNASLICSIGAVFDFYAGTVKRPNKFWISIGLEWLIRLLREPQRLWRRTFFSAPLFIWFVFREKLR